MDNGVGEVRPMEADEVTVIVKSEFHHGNENNNGDPNVDARRNRGEKGGAVTSA